MRLQPILVLVPLIISIGLVFTTPTVSSVFATVGIPNPFSPYCHNDKSGNNFEGPCPGNSGNTPNKHEYICSKDIQDGPYKCPSNLKPRAQK
jgi:hypothetical protein